MPFQERLEESQKALLAERGVLKYAWDADVKGSFPSCLANPRDRPRNATVRSISIRRLKDHSGRADH